MCFMMVRDGLAARPNRLQEENTDETRGQHQPGQFFPR